MHVQGDDIPALLRSVLSVHRAPVIGVGSMNEVVASMRQAHQAAGEDSPTARCLAAGAAWRLFALLATGHDHAPDARAAVAAIRDGITDDPSADVHLPGLAARAGLSVSRFSTLFQEVTGTGPVAFARRQRIVRAKHLLVTTALPVTAVSKLVGYSDPLYFSRVFRAETGTSPTHYRRRHHKAQPL